MKLTTTENKLAINLDLDWSVMESQLELITRDLDINPTVDMYETDEDLFLAEISLGEERQEALDSNLL